MRIKIGDRVSTKYGEASIVTIDEVQLGEKYGHEVFEANLGSADSICERGMWWIWTMVTGCMVQT